MPFRIIRNNICQVAADAIVCPANPAPLIGGGTEYAIHRAAGPELLSSREKIGVIEPGDARITPGFRLPATFVIHTVGPVWRGGSCGEAAVLRQCFQHSLALAQENSCKSIAFPLISTGTYGFPNSLALEIAVSAFSSFLMKHDMDITLVVFHQQAFQISEKLFAKVDSFISENYVNRRLDEEYPADFSNREAFRFQMESPMRAAALSLEEMLQNRDQGFSATLAELIQRSGKKNSEIYKRANVDKKLFSKIMHSTSYHPSKPTAAAFAIALELSLEETRDLLARAGYSMTRSSKFDIILEYFLLQCSYDIFEINEVLFRYDQPLLGL